MAETSDNSRMPESRSLLDHCPDVVGKSTYGKSISSVDAMSLGMLLRLGVSISARSTLFPISNFTDNRPPAVGRGRDDSEVQSVLEFVEFNSVIIVRWAAPSYVLQLKSLEEDDGVP
ncbi:hypothetical protein EVAR_98952_1 [Eumeta japonica]|uniref:Uncharacterized protein n=1 Tax=Eumeta variegata TaxID=151549 RepID=A0A4C2ADY2_EUMVA|nr:hypothetical protein EVAR_98952_1 [Eumeta japonica]